MDRELALPPCRTRSLPAPCSRPRRRGPKPQFQSPCSACAVRGVCVAPCEKLEALLPGVREAEPCLAIPVEIAESAGEWRRENGQIRKFLFGIFLRHQRELTKGQRKVVQLVYGEDLSTREGASRLGISQPVFVRQLRAARGRILRKMGIALRTSGGTQGNGEPKAACEMAALNTSVEEDEP